MLDFIIKLVIYRLNSVRLLMVDMKFVVCITVWIEIFTYGRSGKILDKSSKSYVLSTTVVIELYAVNAKWLVLLFIKCMIMRRE